MCELFCIIFKWQPGNIFLVSAILNIKFLIGGGYGKRGCGRRTRQGFRWLIATQPKMVSIAYSLEIADVVEIGDYLGNLVGQTKLGFDYKVYP